MTLVQFDLQESLLACHRAHASGCMKVDEDLERYAHVIERTRPDVIVECGTDTGYSATWFTEHDVDVVTIDIPFGSGRKYTRPHVNRPEVIPAEFLTNPRITWLVGDSTSDAIVSLVIELVEDRRTMVVLDSDHSAVHVRREIELYGKLVSPECFLVVEDGILRWLPSDYVGNPLDAIESTLVDSMDWRHAVEIETMSPVTLYPGGWWQKL